MAGGQYLLIECCATDSTPIFLFLQGGEGVAKQISFQSLINISGSPIQNCISEEKTWFMFKLAQHLSDLHCRLMTKVYI